MQVEAESELLASVFVPSTIDPSMVNAYMYQPGAGSGQAAQQGQAVPTTTPAYSSYQPTPTQGYQASEGRVACDWLGRGLGHFASFWHREEMRREGERAGWSWICRCFGCGSMLWSQPVLGS